MAQGDDNATGLGAYLRDARHAKRMTLRQLATAMGVSAPFLSDVEHDRRTLTIDRMSQAAKVLGVPVEDLEARGGVSRELVEWIRSRPDVLTALHNARRIRAAIAVIPNVPRRAPVLK